MTTTEHGRDDPTLRAMQADGAMPSPVDAAHLAAAHLGGDTLAVILGGGRGTRLCELTDWRAKPAVLFGSRYRIIDFALANCINSGLRRIAVLTQYKAQSLIRHLQESWSMSRRFGEFVEIVPAQQRVGVGWNEGTAVAVFQNLDLIDRHHPSFVLVLGGDHVYKMDYTAFIADHVQHGAEASVACIEVPLEDARAFGVMQVDERARIVGWQEKPRAPRPIPGRPGHALASMGIYVFDTAVLLRELAADAADPASAHDFGQHLLPRMIRRGAAVHAHSFRHSCMPRTAATPYWRDVGTLDAYWEANLDLACAAPAFDLFDRSWPIPTVNDCALPSRFLVDEQGRHGELEATLIGSGCTIGAAAIRRSVLFSDLAIHHGARIDESLLLSEVEVGPHVVLQRAIVDKYCRLPPGLVVGRSPAADRRRFHVTPRGITLITPEMLGQRSGAPPAPGRRAPAGDAGPGPASADRSCAPDRERMEHGLLT